MLEQKHTPFTNLKQTGEKKKKDSHYLDLGVFRLFDLLFETLFLLDCGLEGGRIRQHLLLVHLAVTVVISASKDRNSSRANS